MDTDKLIGKDPEQAQTSAATQLGIGQGTTRRRLLKGAAMGAPVILTLRSGALMAAGTCISTKKASETILNTDHCVTASYEGCTDDKVLGSTITEGAPPASIPPATAYSCNSNHPIVISSLAWGSLTQPTQ
jgi:hypothetical protein